LEWPENADSGVPKDSLPDRPTPRRRIAVQTAGMAALLVPFVRCSSDSDV
jgi:hypothetical protein